MLTVEIVKRLVFKFFRLHSVRMLYSLTYGRNILLHLLIAKRHCQTLTIVFLSSRQSFVSDN